MPLKENIIAIRELLTDPDHWCQGKMSQNKLGHYANHSSREATSWCMVGAMCKVMGINTYIKHEYIELRDFIEIHLPGEACIVKKRIEAWNDDEDRTHQDVLDFLDEAIASLEPKKARIVKEERILENA